MLELYFITTIFYVSNYQLDLFQSNNIDLSFKLKNIRRIKND